MTLYPLLALRTDFSLGESLIGTSDLAEAMSVAQTDVVCVTDTMSVNALIEGTKAVSKVDGRLILGVRIRVVMAAERDKTIEPSYLKLYPVNEKGLQCIYRILSRGFEEDRFYYVPRVTWDDLHELIENDCLVISTGDCESVIQRQEMYEALATLCDAKSFVASFYELVADSTPYYSRQNKRAIDWAGAHSQLGFEPLAVMPTFWLGDDAESYSVIAGIAEKRPYADYLRPAPNYKPHSKLEFAQACAHAKEAVEQRYGGKVTQFADGLRNQKSLVKLCAYEWSKKDPCLPEVDPDPDARLTAMCKQGFKDRFSKPMFGYQPDKSLLATEYMPRLKYELDTLKRLGFTQYFLLVSDLVRWSKENGIFVGPGRGSVGGSLVAFLVGITDVDPVRFELLFERFINPDRLDLPDADLDFMSTRREEVIAYLAKRWGEDNTAGIANYNTMGARSSIRDVARIYSIPQDQLGATKFIGDEHGISETLEQAHAASSEIQQFAQRLPQIWNHALKLEGRMRAYGTHAAGIVVAGCPLTERAVVERRGGARAINWDKRVSEEQGLIKLDVLGLSTLDMFDFALKLIFDRRQKKIDINQLALDDPDTLRIFDEARTAGVFQFDGASVRRMMREMAADKPLTFDDLVALNALNRPGPLDAGLAESYIKRRAGKEAITYPHPSLEPILKPTFGVMAYQEQIMQITRTLSGFTPGEADGVRKAIGKKDLAKMAAFKEKFLDGAEQVSGMPRPEAEALWDDIEGFAAYSFNKSHSVEYTLIAYQAAWLKAHYPVEFYAASMSIANSDKLPTVVKKAAEDGIRVIPPDINFSTDRFEPLNDTIIAAPLSAVKNVSSTGARAIIFARKNAVVCEESSGRGKNKVTQQVTYGPGKFLSIEDFRKRVPGRAVNSRAIEHLDKVGAFARVEPGQPRATDPCRQKDQIELMPELADQAVVADRDIAADDLAADNIIELEQEMRDKLHENAQPCHLGLNPKMMVILDAPFNDYEELSSQYSYQKFVAPALHRAGLSIDDAVWTWLIRRPLPKGQSSPTAEDITACLPFLEREIAAMKPPVIVLLGNAVVKQFFPDIKRPNESVGHTAYRASLDATVIVGFKPTQIYFDASKEDTLTQIFEKAASLINLGA